MCNACILNGVRHGDTMYGPSTSIGFTSDYGANTFEYQVVELEKKIRKLRMEIKKLKPVIKKIKK